MQEREFHGALVSGGTAGPIEHIRLLMRENTLDVQTQKRENISRIPYAGIREIVYSNVKFSRSTQVGSFYFSNFCCSSAQGEGAGGVVLFGLALMLASAPFPGGKTHFVDISWSDEGTYQVYHFELPKNEYKAFLEMLQARSGKDWTNPAKERDRILASIADQKTSPIILELDRAVKIDKLQLAQGKYFVVPYDRSAANVALMLFPNENLDVKELVAVFDSTIIRVPQDVTAPKVVYSQKGIAEIRLPDRTYRIR